MRLRQRIVQLLRQHLAIAAPGDLGADRLRLHVGVGHGLVAGVENLFWLSWVTCTSPSTTATREPFTPAVTSKSVPVTATRQSPVSTYRCPLVRCLAFTITLPRPKRTLRSSEFGLAERLERSRISTSDPSASCNTASESLAVRNSTSLGDRKSV